MPTGGYAIRCPACYEWTEGGPEDLERIAIKPEDWERIRAGMDFANPDAPNDHLLRCGHRGRHCPMPFQALVFHGIDTAHAVLEDIPSWGVKRAFRLRQKNQEPRDEGSPFSAVTFHSFPVRRLRHVELEHVLDEELLSRAIVGFAEEIKAPLTIYAAHAFRVEGKDRTVWVPVEARNQEQDSLVPPRYNPVCDKLRSANLAPIWQRFMAARYTTATCPIRFGRDGRWGGRSAPCEPRPGDEASDREVNWVRCPAFLAARAKEDPCYQSDLAAIEKIEQSVESCQSRSDDPEHCWIGFREIAFPIVVHKTLVAVAMSGQFVTDGYAPPLMSYVTERSPGLTSAEDGRKLETFFKILKKSADKPDETEDARRLRPYRVKAPQFDAIRALVEKNAERIENVANPRYLHLRARSEAAFRQEVYGRFLKVLFDDDGSRLTVEEILPRMREFWAFEHALLLTAASGREATLSLVGRASRNLEPVFHAKPVPIGVLAHELTRRHPYPFPVAEAPGTRIDDHWRRDVLDLLRAKSAELGVGPSLCPASFVVAYPMDTTVTIFAFVARGAEAISPFKRCPDNFISTVCEDAILETCWQLANSLHDNSLQARANRNLRGFIDALNHAMDLNDPYTSSHSKGVANVAMVVARFAGAPADTVEQVWLAGVVHDIGKLALNPMLIEKPRQLNYAETAMMRTHAEIGHSILSEINDLRSLALAARQHHERHDGNGYPQGLKGEGIDEIARYIAVADAYDAMTTDRAYRAALGHDKAVRIIIEERGRQFHPAAVDAFVRACEAGALPVPATPKNAQTPAPAGSATAAS